MLLIKSNVTSIPYYMKDKNSLQAQQGKFSPVETPQFEDFLTPEQRRQAIAEILGTMALKAVRKRHEAQQEGRQYEAK